MHFEIIVSLLILSTQPMGNITWTRRPLLQGLVLLSAAGGRNQPAVSDQPSAFSLAISVQLLYQHREHAFEFDSL